MVNEFLFIVDLTGLAGNLRSVIDSLRQQTTSRYAKASFAWLVRQDQITFISTSDKVRIKDDSRPVAFILKEWIAELSSDGARESAIHVWTKDGTALTEAVSLNGPLTLVVGRNLARVLNEYSVETDNTGLGAPVSQPGEASTLITIDEALKLTREILEQDNCFSPETGLLIAKLRPRLQKLDPRARRDSSSASKKLIWEIRVRGQKEGWLGYDQGPQYGGMARIWVKRERGHITLEHASARAPEPVERASAGSKLGGQGVMPRTPRPSVSNILPNQLAKAMQNCLSKDRVGSPAVPREFMYEALEAIVGELGGGSIPTSELIAKVWRRAQGRAAESGYNKQQQWAAIGECFQNMLLASEVLIDAEGVVISSAIGSRSRRVANLRPDYRDRCEALLVERILRGLDGVEYSDFYLYNIGLALFQRGGRDGLPREDLVSRADALLALLLNEGRIETNSEGLIGIRQSR